MDLSKELIEKAKNCQTAEELITLAKENDIELSAEEAALYLQDFAEGELSDEELDNVAGGQEGCAKPFNPHEDIFWDKKEDVQFIFKKDDIVEARAFFCNHHTATCKVVNTRIKHIDGYGYSDEYWLEKLPGVRAPLVKGWRGRHDIEK